MIGLGGAVDADMNIRAAALELAVDAYDPDQVMVSFPGARVAPAAEEIVETARVFEAYLRGEAEPEPDGQAEEPDRWDKPIKFVRLADLRIDGQTLDDHLAKCVGCRSTASAAGLPVPPWMGGRSGG